MARAHGERPHHEDDGEASRQFKHPGGKFGKRGSRERAPDSGQPSIATAHDVMALTNAERAALSDQAYEASLQKLIAEQGQVRNPRAKGQLQARIQEMQDERPAVVPVESPTASPKQTPETATPPVEPSPEPVLTSTPVQETQPTETTGSGDISEEELRKILGDDYDSVVGKGDEKPSDPTPAPRPDTAPPAATRFDAPTPVSPAKPSGYEITEDELRKILGDDYDSVVGKGPEAAPPVTPDSDAPKPDATPPLADLGAPVETPNTPPTEADPVSQTSAETGPMADTRPMSIAEIRSSWNEPLASLSEQDETILQDLSRDIVPRSNEWVLERISAYTEALKTETTAAQSADEGADKQRLLRDAEMRRRKLLLLLSTAEYRKLPVDGTPTEQEPAPIETGVSAGQEVTPDADPTPNPQFTVEERDFLINYPSILSVADNAELERTASQLDLQTRQLLDDIDATADPEEQARLRHTLGFVRARRDMVSGNILTRRVRASDTAAPDADTPPVDPDAIPSHTTPDISPAIPSGDTTPPIETPPPSPVPIETSPALPEAPESNEPLEPTPLEQARAKAARALMKRGQIFGRMSDKELGQHISEYQEAIVTELQPKVDQINRDFAGRDLTQPDVARALQERLVNLALNDRFAEETALREAMKSSGERSAGRRFKEFWRKNSGKRALIGIGLLGAGIATGGLASPVLGAAILGARVAMSAAGSTMMTEGSMQALGEKIGRTKKLSREQIAHLDRSKLRGMLAAHVSRYGESEQADFGTHTTKLLKKSWSDDTGKMLLEEYQMDQQKEVENYLRDHAGETPDQIISGVLENSLDEQSRLHNAYTNERAYHRIGAVCKWVASIGVGTATGVLVALSGMDRLEHAKAAKAAAQGAIEHGSQSPSAIPDSLPGAGSAAETGGRVAGADVSSLDRVTDRVFEDFNETRPGRTLLDNLGGSSDSGQVASAAEAGGTAATNTEVGVGSVEAGSQAAERAASFKEVAHKGDSIWKLVTDQLHKRLGDNFDQLDPARKTYIIDSIKDQMAAHPQEFGLTDINHIDVNQTINFTAAFEGPNAVNLPDVVTHAKELSQQAVDSITHNNEVIGQWISGHPGEPINDTIINHLIHGTSTAAPDATSQTAEFLGANHEQVSTALVDQMTRDEIRQSIQSMKIDPALYARFHAMYPDCYPAIAGVTNETAAPIVEGVSRVNELSTAHLNALEKGMKVLDALPHTGQSRETLHTISELKLSDAIKPSFISTPLEKAGVDYQVAHDVELNFRKVFKDLLEYGKPDSKVKDSFSWLHKRM